MREPKFRGMNVEENQWEYGHGWFHIGYTEEFKKERGIGERTIIYTESGPIECHLESMGEFTGLKDKNGVEIYEGDILKSSSSYNKVFWYEDCWAIEVMKRHSKGGWVVGFKGRTFRAHAKHSEIVGNIYNNPELMEESQ